MAFLDDFECLLRYTDVSAPEVSPADSPEAGRLSVTSAFLRKSDTPSQFLAVLLSMSWVCLLPFTLFRLF